MAKLSQRTTFAALLLACAGGRVVTIYSVPWRTAHDKPLVALPNQAGSVYKAKQLGYMEQCGGFGHKEIGLFRITEAGKLCLESLPDEEVRAAKELISRKLKSRKVMNRIDRLAKDGRRYRW